MQEGELCHTVIVISLSPERLHWKTEMKVSLLPSLTLTDSLFPTSVSISFMSNYPCEIVPKCKLIMGTTEGEKEGKEWPVWPILNFPSYTAARDLPLADWTAN